MAPKPYPRQPIFDPPRLTALRKRISQSTIGIFASAGSVGVRLVQDSYNMLSIFLYASFGFEVKEPLLLMRGQPKDKPRPGAEVRAIRKEDLGECAALCRKVHGIERLNELQDGLKTLSPLIAWREGQVVAYALALHRWPRNHAVAKTEEDTKTLLLGAAPMNSEPMSLLLPVRQASLFSLVFRTGGSEPSCR